jgi:hypothetical protein
VRRALLALGLIAALASAAASWARDTALSGDKSATNLSAFDLSVAWTRKDADGVYRLVSYSRAATLLSQPVDLPVRPSEKPFDPDVGKSKRGAPLVVYTRCAGVSGKDCDVYQFDGKRESKVKGASSSHCSEFAPSVWNGTVAFGRTGPGTCKGLYVKGERGTALRLDKRVPADTDLRRGMVAYLLASSQKSDLRLFTIKQARSRIVVAAVTGRRDGFRISNPTFDGSYVYWLFEDLRRNRFTAGRSRGGPRSVIQWSDRSLPGSVDSIAVDGRTLYYTNGRGVREANDPTPIFGSRD